MILFKCKMCGGDIQVIQGEAIGTCDSCGCTSTLPKVDDDQRVNLHNRANFMRRQNDFDKALAIYEKMIQEDDSDAEAHWGAVLCKYGIEYVEEPGSSHRIPTCHRASYHNILQDVDYLAAVERAIDATAKSLYKEQAAQIAELQKNILKVVQNEKPYDVFICYKETDAAGNRTVDSTIAQDVYYQLENEGLKVFFARITLEGKLGQAYEPYIFSALNSAKVMVVVGTQADYYNATWVKNEWSRYLSIIKNNKQKLLIPCYRDMDPYEIPDELSMLQSQNMSKIGFMQDLIRGIKKVMEVETPPVIANVLQGEVPVAGSQIDPLLKRAGIFLADKDWEKAKEYYDKVLDMDPEYAEAYLGLALVDFKFKSIKDIDRYKLEKSEDEFTKESLTLNSNLNMKKAIQYGNEKLKKEIVNAIDYTVERNKETFYKSLIQKKENINSYSEMLLLRDNFRKLKDFKDAREQVEECSDLANEFRYKEAVTAKDKCTTFDDYIRVHRLFERQINYKDATEQCKSCIELANEILYKRAIEVKESSITHYDYYNAKSLFARISDYKDSQEQIEECVKLSNECRYKEAIKLLEVGTSKSCDEAISIFREISDYKDSQEQIEECNRAIKKLDDMNKKRIKIIISIIILIGVLCILWSNTIKPMMIYNKGVSLLEQGEELLAIDYFEQIPDYKDSTEMLELCLYNGAMKLYEQREELAAIDYFEQIPDYKDSTEILELCLYNGAMKLNDQGEELEAKVLLMKSNNEDVKTKLNKLNNMNTISAGGGHTVGLKADGTVVAVGDYYYSQRKVEDWSEIVSISAGSHHTVGLKADGTVVAAGSHIGGWYEVVAWSEIVSISVGYSDTAWFSHTVGLKADGTVVAVGGNGSGQCEVEDWLEIVSISAGFSHTVGLKADGTVVAVGYNKYGQCEVGDWSEIVSISAGHYHTVGLKADGTVVAVGDNREEQCEVEDWSGIVSISAGSSHTVGLKADGTVVAVGGNGSGQCEVGDWSEIVSISAGDYHTVGLKADGTVIAIGSNKEGQCNVSTWSDIRVNGLAPIFK